MSLRRLAAYASIAAACGCGYQSVPTGMGAGGGGGTTNTNANVVSAQDYAFSPSSESVKMGATVTFTNYGAAAHHPVADGGGWDAGELAPAQTGAYGMGTGVGGSASVVFSSVGTFTYHCTIHPQMTGTITVTQ